MHRDHSNIYNCRTKILAIFGVGLKFFFAVFQNSYVFIALFLSEALTMLCGTLRFRETLFDRHWCVVLIDLYVKVCLTYVTNPDYLKPASI